MRCPVCDDGSLVVVDDLMTELEGLVFVEGGHRCDSCGEEFVDERDSERTIRVAKRLGVWGEPLKLRRKLSKSGRGVVLRIPTDLQESMGLKGNEEVLLSKVGRKRVLIELAK
jgi:hypothetical protein